MLPLDLEDWLTDEGDVVIRKAVAANSHDILTPTERLLYELWLFDTEQRNGGVSQYFCNRGLKQWDTLSRLAASTLPSFNNFAERVNSVVGRSDDPYMSIIASKIDLDSWYLEHQKALVLELQATVGNSR